MLFWSFLVHCILVINCSVINEIGRLYIEETGFPGAENIAVDVTNNRIFAADGHSLSLNVISYSLTSDVTASTKTLEKVISFGPIFENWDTEQGFTLHDVTAVTYNPKGFVVSAAVPLNYSIFPGAIVFVNTTSLDIIKVMEIEGCFLPDHISITSDGSTAIVSCEGEPDDNEAEFPEHNPKGNIAIIDTSSNDVDDWTATLVNFEKFDDDIYSDLIDQLYITHQYEPFSINAEPEYTTLSDDDNYAYISLQEQNAIAVLDIEAQEILKIFPLGFNDFSVVGLDASDTDGKINIQTYPNLYGMRAPDSITYMLSEDNRHYLFTANEGDTKDFDESRVSKLVLCNKTFGEYNITDLQLPENLGRLKVTNLYGRNDDDEYEKLFAFSSRDFTAWEVLMNANDEPSELSLVYSSENIFELITAELLGEEGFNSDYFNPSFDERSDAKGPEPESIIVGKCNNGRKYVFIGMERSGGIFVFDISLIDEGEVEYVEYFYNQNYSVIFEEETRPPHAAGDVGPEQFRWIDEDVYGYPMLVVAYPRSASVTMYRIDCGEYIDTSDSSDSSDDSEDSEDEFKSNAIKIAPFCFYHIFLAMCFALSLYF